MLRNIRNDHISISKEDFFSILDNQKPLSLLADIVLKKKILNENEEESIKKLFPELFL